MSLELRLKQLTGDVGDSNSSMKPNQESGLKLGASRITTLKSKKNKPVHPAMDVENEQPLKMIESNSFANKPVSSPFTDITNFQESVS